MQANSGAFLLRNETGPVKVADFTGLKRKKNYTKHFLNLAKPLCEQSGAGL
jgi:hypothetical protein